MSTLDDLPDELVLEVIRSLRSVGAIGSLAATSWRYNRLTMDDSLWRDLYLEHFGASASAERFHGKGKTWRWLYRARLPACLTAPTSVGTAVGHGYVYSGDWAVGIMHGVGLASRLTAKSLTRLDWFSGLDPETAAFPRWCSVPPSAPVRADYDMYEGELKGGRPDGYGIMTYMDGTRYEGEWKGGRRHGRGTFIDGYGDSTPTRVECEWRDDRCEGDATVIRDNYTWTGDVAQDSFHGMVTLVYPDGRVWGKWKGTRFKGLIFHSDDDGPHCSGMCKKGYAHGPGVLHQSDGRRYEASWWRGTLDDDGIISYPDGSCWRGVWLCGDRRGESVVAHGHTPANGESDCGCMACLDTDGYCDGDERPDDWHLLCTIEVFDKIEATQGRTTE
ncbi:Morn repeat domain containing protein [Pandoravirus salinus]|uniref:Morn repeat domain containing protein n=1 Tax=Pandoravirus salinus TaxID=1349410 RepID=S4VY74_9VIRU|nr:morn repeat domain [Pandoravirus salinus]AGO84411.1 Morn repeat domain containing protein [Pandoravirus salinus]